MFRTRNTTPTMRMTAHMAPIARRKDSSHARVRPSVAAPVPGWILLALATSGCLPAMPDVQCIDDANCNRFAGGVCHPTPSGHQWCSYPDAACPSGYRYSDLDIGDGVSGKCAETTYRLSLSVEGD